MALLIIVTKTDIQPVSLEEVKKDIDFENLPVQKKRCIQAVGIDLKDGTKVLEEISDMFQSIEPAHTLK